MNEPEITGVRNQLVFFVKDKDCANKVTFELSNEQDRHYAAAYFVVYDAMSGMAKNGQIKTGMSLYRELLSAPQKAIVRAMPGAAAKIATALAKENEREDLINFIEELNADRQRQHASKTEENLISVLVADKVVGCLMGVDANDEIAERALTVIVGKYELEDDDETLGLEKNFSPENFLKILAANCTTESLAKEGASSIIRDFVLRRDSGAEMTMLLMEPKGVMDLFVQIGPFPVAEILRYLEDFNDEELAACRVKFLSDPRMVKHILTAIKQDKEIFSGKNESWFDQILNNITDQLDEAEMEQISTALGPKLFAELKEEGLAREEPNRSLGIPGQKKASAVGVARNENVS